MIGNINITDTFLRRIVYAIGIMGVISFGFYTINLLKSAIAVIMDILTPFMAALLMAYILAPVVIALQRKLKLGRIMGTLTLYLIIILAFLLLTGFLIPKFLSEFIKLAKTIKTALPTLLIQISENEHFKIDPELIELIRHKISEIEIDYEKIASSILPGLKSIASGGLSAVGRATVGFFSSVSSVFGFFSFLAFVGIINFYLIVDWEKIGPLIKKMIPQSHQERVFHILNRMDIAVGGFLRGQITVSIIVGTLFAIGLFCMGFIGFPALRNYCILIGTAAAIGGFIPYLGAVIGVAPAALIIVLTSGITWKVKIISLVVVLVLFSIIQTIEGFVLQPKIVGKGAGLHPLVVMLALIAGAQFGIGGMIIAVPLASVIRVIVLEFYWLPLEQRLNEKTVLN